MVLTAKPLYLRLQSTSWSQGIISFIICSSFLCLVSLLSSFLLYKRMLDCSLSHHDECLSDAASVSCLQLSLPKPFVCRSTAIGSMLMQWLGENLTVALCSTVNRAEGQNRLLHVLWRLVYHLLSIHWWTDLKKIGWINWFHSSMKWHASSHPYHPPQYTSISQLLSFPHPSLSSL